MKKRVEIEKFLRDIERVNLPAFVFTDTKECNKYLVLIEPSGEISIDGGHDTPTQVAEAKKLYNSIDILKPKQGGIYRMITIEEVPNIPVSIDIEACNTINNLSIARKYKKDGEEAGYMMDAALTDTTGKKYPKKYRVYPKGK